MNKRGQIAIFVIIALVIVGAIIAIFVFPKVGIITGPREINPESYLRDCLQPEVKGAIELLGGQGGYVNPTAFITYQNTKIQYLCYTAQYYQTCVVQQPLLITHFENELSRILTPKADACVKNLVSEYEKRGFSVSYAGLTPSISLASGNVIVEYSAPMTITQGETTRKFDGFDVGVNSEIYDLLSIGTSIIDYESTYGDSETTNYLRYYPDLRIDKIKLEDGIRIYKLTDVTTNELFQFTVRSLVWPPGYGL